MIELIRNQTGMIANLEEYGHEILLKKFCNVDLEPLRDYTIFLSTRPPGVGTIRSNYY